MMKRTHLRQFLAVVETGGFTAAARRLNVTQPTLSSGIAELERLVGAVLFLRDRRAVRLTDAGNRLLAHARAIEREFRAAEASLGALAQAAPPLRLGALASIATATLVAIAKAYDGEAPLALVEGSETELRRKLADGQIEAALLPLRPEERAPLLIEEGYAMMLPASHPLAGFAMLQPAQLAGETMIARRSCEILAETSRFFTQAGVRPRFFLRSANDDRCLAMVRAGMGVTTAPLSLQTEGVVAVPLAGYDFRRRIGLVCTTGNRIAPALLTACAAASGFTGATNLE